MLVSAILLLIVMSTLTACIMSAAMSRAATRLDRIQQLRAAAAAAAGEHLALWKIKQDAALQDDLAIVIAKQDTSFKETPLITASVTLGGATCTTDIWPGDKALRVRSVGRAGECFVERWTEWPIIVK